MTATPSSILVKNKTIHANDPEILEHTIIEMRTRIPFEIKMWIMLLILGLAELILVYLINTSI